MGLLWMRRAVAFQHRFHSHLLLRDGRSDEVSTIDAALESYRVELEPFHSWPLQRVFRLTFRTTTPDRARTLAALLGGDDGDVNPLDPVQQDIVLRQLRVLAEIWEPVSVFSVYACVRLCCYHL